MSKALLLLAGGLALSACAAPEAADPAATPPAAVTPAVATAQMGVTLSPRLELIGLADVYDALQVTDVHFGAELYLLPDDDTAGDDAGDAVPLDFTFEDGRAVTTLPDGALQLGRAGRYRVLVRVRPDAAGTSVEVTGGYSDPTALGKADEPTPTPAEPTPTPAEPTPTPAKPVNPADNAQAPQAEPTPTPAEPTPTPAEPTPAEPTPTPAEPTPTPAEPTPTPAEPTPTPARGKAGSAVVAQAQSVYVRSTRDYEFFAGTIAVAPGAQTLVVTWDVRDWFRALLAQPLGIPEADRQAAPKAAAGGFVDQPENFRLLVR